MPPPPDPVSASVLLVLGLSTSAQAFSTGTDTRAETAEGTAHTAMTADTGVGPCLTPRIETGDTGYCLSKAEDCGGCDTGDPAGAAALLLGVGLVARRRRTRELAETGVLPADVAERLLDDG